MDTVFILWFYSCWKRNSCCARAFFL